MYAIHFFKKCTYSSWSLCLSTNCRSTSTSANSWEPTNPPPYTSAGSSAKKNEEDHQVVRINQTTKNALMPQFCNDKCHIKLKA